MSFTINRLSRKRPAALVFAILFATLSLVLLEGTFRLKGFQPSLSNADSLWAVSRAKADDEDAGIILVGSSRFQLGIDPTQLAKETNTSVVNLSVYGTSPFPILHDLVKSEVKPDIVLFEYIPWRWVNELPANIEKANGRLGYFHNQPYVSRYEVFLRTQLGERWVALNPTLNLRSLPGQLFPSKDSDRMEFRIHPDRFMETLHTDFKTGDKIKIPEAPIKEDHPDPKFWINNSRQQLENFEAAVISLQNSGTEVIVFRIPVCEGQLVLDRERYGEPDLFNELASRSQATWLAPDQLELPDIECIDGNHLTTESAHTVTTALAEWLQVNSFISTMPPL